ncbi:unnamed protein product [Arctogadus glacialis]
MPGTKVTPRVTKTTVPTPGTRVSMPGTKVTPRDWVTGTRMPRIMVPIAGTRVTKTRDPRTTSRDPTPTPRPRDPRTTSRDPTPRPRDPRPGPSSRETLMDDPPDTQAPPVSPEGGIRRLLQLLPAGSVGDGGRGGRRAVTRVKPHKPAILQGRLGLQGRHRATAEEIHAPGSPASWSQTTAGSRIQGRVRLCPRATAAVLQWG